MSLFACPHCNVVENTATGFFWNAKRREEVRCSECYSGKWHGRFPKMQADDEWILDDHQHGSDVWPPFITKPIKESS
ncbi:hypothetical protein [Salipiger sp. PrR003]|uniref:hypothetical protein n=1 Tax=Salipiger sp. PrR003 TaxID=2706776 RepID=UPI0013DD16B0|nr:hypothetical protein [Salipiger sp. PrR003]NDV51513.1 hypothetical protein [Salipiger sp. PrR003]